MKLNKVSFSKRFVLFILAMISLDSIAQSDSSNFKNGNNSGSTNLSTGGDGFNANAHSKFRCTKSFTVPFFIDFTNQVGGYEDKYRYNKIGKKIPLTDIVADFSTGSVTFTIKGGTGKDAYCQTILLRNSTGERDGVPGQVFVLEDISTPQAKQFFTKYCVPLADSVDLL